MIELRPAALGDLDRLVELNNANVPAVSHSTPEHMVELLEWAALAWVVTAADDGIAGFVLLFEPGSPYASPNYRWFCDRYERFLYVDRIVVSSEARGAGLGEQLYEAVTDEARTRGSERVTAEVNLEPPNPGSSRFHRRIGFDAVGTQRMGDDYEVEMMVWDVRSDRRSS